MNFGQIRKLNATEMELKSVVARLAELCQQLQEVVKRLQILEEEVKVLQRPKPATRRFEYL